MCAFGVALALAGCDSGTDERPTVFGGDRPTELRVPPDYAGEAAPLLVVLHGYGVNGAAQFAYTRFDNIIQSEGLLVLSPDGIEDADGELHWNVEHAGCTIGAGGNRADDASYLLGLIDEVTASYNVDPGRIFIFGHSNGAFMAHRLACDNAERFAAIISVAGALGMQVDDCPASRPVGVLQIHGDADTTVSYSGGDEIIGFDCPYPGAAATVERWAGSNNCSGTLTDAGVRMDLDTGIDGDETVVSTYDCPDASAELWTIVGGGHVPSFPNDVYQPMWDFLSAHAR